MTLPSPHLSGIYFGSCLRMHSTDMRQDGGLVIYNDILLTLGHRINTTKGIGLYLRDLLKTFSVRVLCGALQTKLLFF